MHFVIAIPTFNRLEYLKKNIFSIKKQKINSNIKLSVCISNSASSDETGSYLNVLTAKNENIIIFNDKLESEYLNNGCLASIIPQDADWVWYLGDDDFFVSENAINDVIKVILDNDIDFIHVSQSRRSAKTFQLLIEKSENLSNRLGYLEFFGWISSVVIKKNLFINALKNTQSIYTKQWPDCSAFIHSYFFYNELYGKSCAFFDSGSVEPQDLKQTEQSIKRWKNENIPERYLFVINDFINMSKNNLLPSCTNNTFFRYQNINIWDRWLIYLINETIRDDYSNEFKTSQEFLKKIDFHWLNLVNFVNIISDPPQKKKISIMVKTIMGLCVKFLFDKDNQKIYKPFLIDQINLLKESCYDFKTFYE